MQRRGRCGFATAPAPARRLPGSIVLAVRAPTRMGGTLLILDRDPASQRVETGHEPPPRSQATPPSTAQRAVAAQPGFETIAWPCNERLEMHDQQDLFATIDLHLDHSRCLRVESPKGWLRHSRVSSRRSPARATGQIGELGGASHMKAIYEYLPRRTHLVIVAMLASAFASTLTQSQELDCNSGCGVYAEYALAQRLNFPPPFQNMGRVEIEKWFSRHPKYTSKLKALVEECQRSCARCGDWSCPSP